MVGFEIRDQNEKERERLSVFFAFRTKILRFTKTPVNSLYCDVVFNFYTLMKNGLSFGHDISEQCRCVEFVGVIIIKDFELGLKMKPRHLALRWMSNSYGSFTQDECVCHQAWFNLQVF